MRLNKELTGEVKAPKLRTYCREHIFEKMLSVLRKEQNLKLAGLGRLR